MTDAAGQAAKLSSDSHEVERNVKDYLLRVLLVFGVGATLVACSPAEMPPTTRACVPGESRTCACTGGRMGAQSCNGAGSGYDPCTCPPEMAARCGDGRCDSMETCSSCASDCGMCMARCGDGTCNGTETCSSCASDCGRCAAPACGDGTCNGSETCSSCSDDCGMCPARCGDGVCNGAETCSSCAGDCGRCETMCRACAQDADCGAGSFCGLRRCDGARGCYPTSDPAAGCALIGGERCPATAAYNLCTSNSECGAFAVCQRFGDGRSFCARRCTAATDCPTAPDEFPSARPACDMNNTPRTCFLTCTGPGTCPYGLSCFRFDNGSYGYCS